MEKYLFLYLKTGGGHLAPARAVAEKIRIKKKHNIEIILADGMDGAHPIVKSIIEDGYRNAVNKAVWVFELLYALHKVKIIAKFTSWLVSRLLKDSIEDQIIRNKPEKIVLFHFFLIEPVYRVIKRHRLEVPVITVVTDPFTAHPIWFLRKNQNYIIFSEMLKEKCMLKGINEEKLKVFPFVLDQRYNKKPGTRQQLEIRKRLGFREDSRIILIMGGGDGMPRGKKILKSIIINNIDAEIAVVSGKNQKMYKHISKLIRKHPAMNIRLYGFIDFVPQLISISDIIITKCGASTFMEILLMGKIQIINNYIWEQEKGNMEYLREKKMGIYEKNITRIPSLISRLLMDDDYYSTHVNNIRKAGISNGVEQVSDYLIKFSS